MSRTSPFDEALAAMRGGDGLRAEAIVVDAVERAAERFGVDSAEHASAQCDLGNILLNVGSLERAVTAMRAACAFVPSGSDTQAARDRLTYVMNLGMLLGRLGRFEEAEPVMRDGLEGRRAFYGEDHAGYAFGAEPLAEMLATRGDAKRGDLTEALALAESAVANFERNRHVRVATALALRAELRKRVRADAPVFDDFTSLPDEMLVELAQAVLGRGKGSEARAALHVLHDLRAMLAPRLGAFHPVMVNVLAEVTNVARAANDAAAREAAFTDLVQLFDAMGASESALEAALGVALAHCEAGREQAALAAYAHAMTRARRVGGAAPSKVHRNVGLYLAELGRRSEADAELRAALELATGAGDNDQAARAGVALGIFLQHGGDLETARACLSAAAKKLPIDDPDALCARSHLDALQSRGACGCGDMKRVVAAALRERVEEQLPTGLLGSLDLDDAGVSIHLTRAMTDDEAVLVERVVRQANESLRKKLSRP